MIAVNGYLVESGTFGDGTLKCPVAPGHILMTSEPNEIVWAYDNDEVNSNGNLSRWRFA